jgi:DeoR family transcriptional regulator, fructose operon transcriptional repressor
MLKEERHLIILKQVHNHNRVLLVDLANLLNVSVDTVRRDIIELSRKKQLQKVHGGAISNDFGFSTEADRKIYQFEKKTIIAKKACKLLSDGNVILISGGTTNNEFAKLLPKNLNLTIFTPSLPVAIQLLRQPNKEIMFLGGKISHDAQIAIGGQIINTLSDIKVDLCFLGSGYVDPIQGLTEFDWEVVQVKKAMLKAAKKSILLSISDKLNSVQKYKTCNISAIDTLITELEPNSPVLLPFKDQEVNIL